MSTRRLDVQGLRAVAVIAVVIFHARLPLPGGFVGVDVFFVISGFVITAMLHREWHVAGRISFATFWRRRFMRLTPALALVIIVTFLLSAFILYPDQQRIAIQTGLGALLLIANVVIARNTGGYFDGPAEANPLLNTWSLSVEEQFYLGFPFLLAVGWALAARRSQLRWMPLALVAVVGAASFGLALLSQSDLLAASGVTWLNFYSPFVRAWEFAAGAIVALALSRVAFTSRTVAVVLAAIGTVGLVTSFLLISSTTPFPGLWTLLPVLATVALLLAGSTHANPVSAALSSAPLVKVGDWSYSIYLWHWPLIVFAAYLGFNSPGVLGFVALVSLVPALASYYWVEQPLRRLHRVPRPKFAGMVAVVVALPALTAAAVVYLLPPAELYRGEVGTAYLTYIDENSHPCTLEQSPGNLSRCRQSQLDAPIDVALIGDSHGEHLYPGLVDALPDTNVSYVYLPNWPFDSSDNSRLTVDQIAERDSIETVIISARWSPGGEERDALRATVAQLAESGKRIFITDDGPYFSFHARECKYQRPGPFFDTRCAEDSSSFTSDYAAYRAGLGEIADEYPNVRILNTAGGFCDGQTCSMVRDGDILFADQGHLNVLGSRFVADRLLAGDSEFSSAMRSG